MATPWKHPSGIYYLRRQIPERLRPEMGGGPVYKESLGTRDPAEAARLFVAANARLQVKMDEAEKRMLAARSLDEISAERAADIVARYLATYHPNLGAYVGVARGHPLFGYEADAIPTGLLSASGGIDYAAPCDQHGNESQSICHVRGGARHDDLWWLSTVCNRIGDLIPDDMAHAREAQRLGITQTYRDAETLFGVCTDLAAELKILEDER